MTKRICKLQFVKNRFFTFNLMLILTSNF